jgi:hypothetical protein
MDGIGRAVESAFLGMALIALVVGAVVALALERLVIWLWTHVSVTWS